MRYAIRAWDGYYWLTSRGFLSKDIKDATLYDDREEASKVSALCCPAKACAEVVAVADPIRHAEV